MKIRIVSLISLIFLLSCSSYKFSKESIFVEDVDEYFNHELRVNVWTYMNFFPYQAGGKTGVRTTDFYDTDLDVLKKVGVKPKGANVLFSAVPKTIPHYNLVAILHEKNLPKIEGFEKKEVNKTQFYLQKDYELGRLDIRHVLIPFEENKKMLSLIYYISSEEHRNCPYCKFEYLAKINAMNLQDAAIQYRDNWIISDNVSDNAIDTHIKVPKQIVKEKGKVLLKLYAQYESETGINYFHILDAKKKEDSVKIKLLPNRYYLEYSDEKFKVIHRDTIQVKS